MIITIEIMYILDNKIYAEYSNIPESILSKTNSTLYWIDDGEDLSSKIPYSGKQLDGREYVNGKMQEDVWIIGHPILESPPPSCLYYYFSITWNNRLRI